jgi:pantetheine-phosphate adenylyltransferase
VAIGLNPNKQTFFSEEERVNMIREVPAIKYCDGNWIQVSSFQGLLIDYAKQIGAKILVRGIRSVSDFEYEINLANINKVLAPEIETVFLPTSPRLAVVSSSMVKEIAKHGGNISDFAASYTVEKVNEKFGFIKTGG